MSDRKTHISLAQEISLPGAQCPGDVRTWLAARGWVNYSQSDDWSHSTKSCFDFTWEQAVSFEFYEFITLGGHRGQAET